MGFRPRDTELTSEQQSALRAYLRQICDSFGTQKDAAPHIGITPAAISKILSGGGVSFATARKMAEHLSVDVYQLLGGESLLPRGVVLPDIVARSPDLMSVVRFAARDMGLTVEQINQVLRFIERAKIKVDFVYLLEAFLSVKKFQSSGLGGG